MAPRTGLPLTVVVLVSKLSFHPTSGLVTRGRKDAIVAYLDCAVLICFADDADMPGILDVEVEDKIFLCAIRDLYVPSTLLSGNIRNFHFPQGENNHINFAGMIEVLLWVLINGFL